ncbi:hypothetical protein EKO27_g4585 [Xylaria grammica]|uniref:Uncharacterized protein n=1 Tax=Xylaria grammica TaxID=363999 RepID=A0A439D801_9PEZI|nr:hypothetical protein EKO27_g4585 [Xylaria grammica]
MPLERDSTPPLGEPDCDQRSQGSQSAPAQVVRPRTSRASRASRTTRTTRLSHSAISTRRGEDEEQPPKAKRIKFVRLETPQSGSDGNSTPSSSQPNEEESQDNSSIITGAQSQEKDDDCNSSDTSSWEPSKYSKLVVKVYINKQLYSIFDHATKSYIYHSKRDAKKGYCVSYSAGACISIVDKSGRPVYVYNKCQKN